MTRKEIAFLFCRLLGVYLFMNGLWRLGDALSSLNFLTNYSMTSSAGSVVININNRPAQATDIVLGFIFRLLPVIIDWAAAAGAWMFAGEIAKRVFDGVPDEIEQGKILEVGREVRSLAFVCLGVFFLLQDSSFLLGSLFSKIAGVITGYPAPSYYAPFAWTMFARMMLSLYLIFGNGGVRVLWNAAQKIDPRTRRAGM